MIKSLSSGCGGRILTNDLRVMRTEKGIQKAKEIKEKPRAQAISCRQFADACSKTTSKQAFCRPKAEKCLNKNFHRKNIFKRLTK